MVSVAFAKGNSNIVKAQLKIAGMCFPFHNKQFIRKTTVQLGVSEGAMKVCLFPCQILAI